MTTKLDYVKWDFQSEALQQSLKKFYQQIETMIDEELQESREKSLTLTKLEESWMWLGKAIKVDQEQREKRNLAYGINKIQMKIL